LTQGLPRSKRKGISYVAICYRIAGHDKQPLKGQDERPLSLDRVWGFFVPAKQCPWCAGGYNMSETWNKRTHAVHGGTRRSQYGEVSEAIFLTQGFVYDSAEAAEARFIEAGDDEFIYARYGNPTVKMFEDRIALIEGAEDAFATASGMAAVSGALTAMLKAGDHVVSSRALFGSCHYVLDEVLRRFGVEVTFVDGTDLDQWRDAIRADTRAVFFESVSNPTLEVIDIRAVCALAHAVGATVLVDNVFATPIYSDAIAQGADVVIYSATKHIDGQGRALGGVILGTKEFIRKTVEPYMKHTGGSMSPFTAWIMLKGLETLSLRVRAQTDSALAVTQAVLGHPALKQVIYPGHESHPQFDLCKAQMRKGGTVLSLDIKGGKAAAFTFVNALKIALISNNLGDAKTIVTHPATTTHQRLTEEQRAELGITPGLVRVSLGIEDTDDLIGDIRQALDAV
jgi:O-succinylhomoserine sulfhydrylase